MKNFREMKIAGWIFVIGTFIVLFLYGTIFIRQAMWLAELELELDCLDCKIEKASSLIPGPAELQRRLNRAEPERPIKVDGLVGPQMIAKWERVYCNQSAAATFKVPASPLLRYAKQNGGGTGD